MIPKWVSRRNSEIMPKIERHLKRKCVLGLRRRTFSCCSDGNEKLCLEWKGLARRRIRHRDGPTVGIPAERDGQTEQGRRQDGAQGKKERVTTTEGRKAKQRELTCTRHADGATWSRSFWVSVDDVAAGVWSGGQRGGESMDLRALEGARIWTRCSTRGIAEQRAGRTETETRRAWACNELASSDIVSACASPRCHVCADLAIGILENLRKIHSHETGPAFLHRRHRLFKLSIFRLLPRAHKQVGDSSFAVRFPDNCGFRLFARFRILKFACFSIVRFSS